MSSQGEATLPATRRTRKSLSARSPSRKLADKENATVDLGSTMAANRKKSRSKSMGPGGLDVLKSGAGNRRVSLVVPSKPPPRSILKPTIPLLPEIPPHKPKQSSAARSAAGFSNSGSDKLNPFDSNESSGAGTKVALRTEEEQQAAAREREERERAQMEKEIKDRREARRKSLANRRVSFAAEATLHTFHEVEEMQDSTTSTDATRRASSVAAPSSAPRSQDHPSSDASEPPSTPPEEAHKGASESPANQRDLHQKKRRRSSGVASMNYNDGEDDTITSTVYDSDLEHADGVTEIQGEEMTDSGDSDEEDGTMMTVEAEEMTSASVASVRSAFSTESTGNLDENLRLASKRAAANQDDDEEEEVIAGFAGWGRKNPTSENITQNMTLNITESIKETATIDEDQGSDMEMDVDMDITSAVGGILKSKAASLEDEDEDMTMDMSMDVTKALGGIISKTKLQMRRKSMKPGFRQVADDTTSFGDQTMELTTAVGGIKHPRISDVSHLDTDSNEDMSIELTTAVGGLLAGNIPNIPKNSGQKTRRRTVAADDEDVFDGSVMDMTVAVGKILPTEVQYEEEEDQTVGMDMTMAVGGILRPASSPEARSAAKKIMEQEANEPDPSITASVEIISSPRRRTSAIVDENGSPEAIPAQDKGLRRSPVRAVSLTAKPSNLFTSLPTKTTTPRRGATPKTQSPAKTPPAMIGSRSSSPLRQTSPAKTTPHSPLKSKTLFLQNPSTGVSTPRVILTPQGRRFSGIGADRPGLGSPRVAEIFDRRGSLGDVTTDFLPSLTGNTRRAVAFADPRAIEAELDKERQDDEEKENSRRILQREVDGPQDDHEATLNLKEMIEGLSPKKSFLRGRKSLHVGSARGVLGKRPAELDDDEAEELDGVKRLKGHQGSPVKNVRLQSPPTKAETTTGRKTRSGLRSAENADADSVTPSTAASPTKATTPKSHGRFRNVGDDQPTNTADFEFTAPVGDVEIGQDEDGERIHLQDFLNMTSIRFMELTTTKRRHTIAPSAPRDSSASDGKEEISLEKCVVAGACTVPMLELYQHSCRELKKYISEGRRIVREIETETFEENPPLFREYISASPEFKVLMDSQFKNVKSHARLLSKAMWYEWRMKLQDGLKEGLLKIAEGMDSDDRVLEKQQELLSSVLPDMMKHMEALEREHEDLEAAARELADCDPQDLQNTRAELLSMDKDIAEKTRKIAELRSQLEESESGIERLTKQKQQCLDEIKEAEKIREECRGWTSTEISALKASTDELERQHGWAITGISGTTMSMSYKREIELVFDIASFQNAKPKSAQNSRIDLWYIGATRERNPLPSTTEKEFFLQCIRDCVRGLPQATTQLKRLLGIVSGAWDKASTVASQVRFVNLTFPTTAAKTSDTSISVTSSVLLRPLQTRAEVTLHLQSVTGGDGVEVSITPEAKIIYGEQFNVAKMAGFLSDKLSNRVVSGGSADAQGHGKAQAWSDVVLELHRKLLAKGQKAAQK
ncbi:hypothetical protein B0T25DRAFT_468116 [Lasiosphaeria hispida]|uniref:Spc7 kinetochore protein domain-containing protein n=1 Tax=Lasiosphaeria hispida TaxID=260671 RepID=A0AAJ0MJP2_9PEZI|nr:hypothetical protein B0T25DRAFT_468116 [Lasiosphaeria hispida]